MAFGPYLKKIEDICRLLSREELQEIIMAMARETLSSLSHGKHRAETAGYLVQAGEKLESNELVLEGKRETFFPFPVIHP